MATSNQLNIIINAVNQTKPAVAQAKKDFESIKDSVGHVHKSTDDLYNMLYKMVGVVRIVSAGFALLKGVQFFKDLADQAARVQGLSTVLHQVASNAGITAGAIDKVDKSVQALGITAQDSRESLAQFIQAGLQATDASKLARAAQDLAVISGENSSQTFRGLTQAIGEMSIMMLRWRGIMVTNEEAQARYAAQMGKSVSSLADWEKKQALLNMVLEKSKTLTGIYEAAMGDASKQASSLARFQEEASNSVNNLFVPAYQSAITELTKFLQFVKGVADAGLNSSDSAKTLGDSVKSLASSFREALEFGIKHREEIYLIAKAYGALKIAQAAVFIGGKIGAVATTVGTALKGGTSMVKEKEVSKEVAAAAAAKAAIAAKTAEARATDLLTASIAANSAAMEKQNALRTLPPLRNGATPSSSPLFMGPVAPNRTAQALNAAGNAAVAAANASQTAALTAQANVAASLTRTESARLALSQALAANKARQFTYSTAELNALRAEVGASSQLLITDKQIAATALTRAQAEAKNLALITAQGVAAAKTAAVQTAAAVRTAQANTVGAGGGLLGSIGGFFARTGAGAVNAGAGIGLFFSKLLTGGGVLAKFATGIASIGRTILSVFGGPWGLAITALTTWIFIGDGIKRMGDAFDYMGQKAKNAVSHVKEFFASKEDAANIAAERELSNKEYDKQKKITATARDPKSVASYKEAAMEAVRAGQEKTEYEYTQAPIAQKLKASSSKEDQEEAVRIEKEIVKKKLEAIAAQAVAESKLAALRRAGKGDEADKITSRLDLEAYEGGKKKQELLDVQDLYKAREEGGAGKSVYNGGEAVSMNVSKAAVLARRELEAYQKNLDGADKSIYRIAFALDELSKSASTVADLNFIKQERLDMFDAAAQKLKILTALTENLGNTKNPFEEGSKDSKQYKAESEEVKRESAVTGVDESTIIRRRKEKEENDNYDLKALGDPSKAFDSTRYKPFSKEEGKDLYTSQRSSGKITDAEEADLKVITDADIQKKKEKLAADATKKGESFDMSKDLNAGQLKEIVDDKKIALALIKFSELRTEVQKLSGSAKEIWALNESFSRMEMSIAKVTKETQGLSKALATISKLETIKIERKYEDTAFNKSESAGSASVDLDRKFAKIKEESELSQALVKPFTKLATESSNVEYADKLVTGQRSQEKLREAATTEEDKVKTKDARAGFGEVSIENKEASDKKYEKAVMEAGGEERLKSTLAIFEVEAKIAELTAKSGGAGDKGAIAALQDQKKKLEETRSANVKEKWEPVVNANGEETGSTRRIAPKEKMLKDYGEHKELYNLQTAFNDNRGTNAAYLNSDPNKLKDEAEKSRVELEAQKSKSKDAVLAKVTPDKKEATAKGVDLELDALTKQQKFESLTEKLKGDGEANKGSDPTLQGKLALAKKELDDAKAAITANRTERGVKADAELLDPTAKKSLETNIQKSYSQDSAASDAAKAKADSADSITEEAKKQGKNALAAEKTHNDEKLAIVKETANKELENAKKTYSELKALRDEYYKAYTDKVKATKELHKADIDLGSSIKTTAAEDSIDIAQTRIAPDKRLVGSLQAGESQQKFEAGANKHAEELAAITTLTNQRKQLIRETVKDEAEAAKQIAAAETDSIAKRLELSRSYFASLETQRKEAKAKWKQYADEVVSIDKEIRSNTLEANASMRDTMRSVMTAPAQLEDLKKEYKELMEAAKAAAAAGDFDNAKDLSKKAGGIAKSIAGHEGGQKLDTTADSISMQKESAELTNGILGKQREIAKKNRDEQLAVVNGMTEAMNGLASKISTLSKKSEILLNPKLDEAALAEVEKKLQEVGKKESNAISIILNAPDVKPAWEATQDYFNKNPIRATISSDKGSSSETSKEGDNSKTSTESNTSSASDASIAANSAAYNKAKAEKKADGGIIQGIGTGTSDSIPAMLSHGEFVVKQEAVEHYGQGFLDLLNGKALRFASGGFVGNSNVSPWANAATVAALAKGGEVPKFFLGGLFESKADKKAKMNAAVAKEMSNGSGLGDTSLKDGMLKTTVGKAAEENQKKAFDVKSKVDAAGAATGGLIQAFDGGGEVLRFFLGGLLDSKEEKAAKKKVQVDAELAKRAGSGLTDTSLGTVMGGTDAVKKAKSTVDRRESLSTDMAKYGAATGGLIQVLSSGGFARFNLGGLAEYNKKHQEWVAGGRVGPEPIKPKEPTEPKEAQGKKYEANVLNPFTLEAGAIRNPKADPNATNNYKGASNREAIAWKTADVRDHNTGDARANFFQQEARVKAAREDSPFERVRKLGRLAKGGIARFAGGGLAEERIKYAGLMSAWAAKGSVSGEEPEPPMTLIREHDSWLNTKRQNERKATLAGTPSYSAIKDSQAYTTSAMAARPYINAIDRIQKYSSVKDSQAYNDSLPSRYFPSKDSQAYNSSIYSPAKDSQAANVSALKVDQVAAIKAVVPKGPPKIESSGVDKTKSANKVGGELDLEGADAHLRSLKIDAGEGGAVHKSERYDNQDILARGLSRAFTNQGWGKQSVSDVAKNIPSEYREAIVSKSKENYDAREAKAKPMEDASEVIDNLIRKRRGYSYGGEIRANNRGAAREKISLQEAAKKIPKPLEPNDPRIDANKVSATLGVRAATGGLIPSFGWGGDVIGGILDFFKGNKKKPEGIPANNPTATIGVRGATGGFNAGNLVPALVSHGEFRVSPDSVNHYGSELLHSINDMTFPKFAEGGMIGSGMSSLGESNIAEKLGEVFTFMATNPKTGSQSSVKVTDSRDRAKQFAQDLTSMTALGFRS